MGTLRNRIIYNTQGVFVGPAPADEYHFIDKSGILNNRYTSLGDNYNLIFPINRVISADINWGPERTEIKSIGTESVISRPNLTSPTVNLSFSYYQIGVLNEARMGLYTNYQQVDPMLSGAPYFPDNYQVSFISGLYSRSLKRVSNDIRWPYEYRDKRNIFLAVRKDNFDLNDRTGNYENSNIDVVGFGNSYLTSYRTAGAVDSPPVCSVSYLCENVIFYPSGSGINIPAVNSQNRTQVTDKNAVIPPFYQSGSPPSILRPGDITLDIYSLPKLTGTYIFGNTGVFGRGNLIRMSETLGNAVWSKTAGVTSTNGTHLGPNGVMNACKVVYDGAGVAGDDRIYNDGGGISENGVVYAATIWLRADVETNVRLLLKPGTNQDITVDSVWRQFSSLSTGDGANSLQYFIRSPAGVNSSFTVYATQAHLYKTSWKNPSYIKTSSDYIHGQIPDSNIKGLGIDVPTANIQSYAIDMSFPREPLYDLTHKLPVDRRITPPIYANLNLSLVNAQFQSGSFLELLNKDDDYNIQLKIRNPNGHLQTGTAVQYDFIRSKFNSIEYSSSVDQQQLVNLSFTAEMHPYNFSRGFFMSGLLNLHSNNKFRDYLRIEGGPDDGHNILTETWDRLVVDDFAVYY